MAYAWFAGSAHLHAALRSVRDDDFWRRPAELYQLGEGEQAAWLLATERLPDGLPAAAVEGLDTESPRVEGQPVTITAHRAAPQLFQVLPLAPRSPARPAVTCLRVHSHERFVEVAAANLMLGNHRLRYLAVGGGAYLLFVEGLSEFLRAKWSGTTEPEFFYLSEHSDALILPWGWTWPPASQVRLPQDSDHDRWLVEPDGTWRLFRGELREVEHLVTVAGGSFEPEVIGPGEPPTVEVQLRLEDSELPAEARLWRVEAADLAILLRLLQEAGEAELAGLQLAALTGGDGPFYLVLARLGGTAPPALLGGRAYAARHATESLFIPVGCRLAPSLSRETLTRALDLDDRTVTILDRLPSARVRVTRVARSVFRPVLDLVDHLAAEAADDVQQLLDQVVFDFDLTADDADGAAALPQPPAPGGCLSALLGRWGRRPLS